MQTIHPRARVVYVDNDPVVHAHASELLAGNPTVTLIEADVRDPHILLGHRELRELIDFSQPTGLLMTYVLHFVSDAADPWNLVRRYVDALPSGSYLALSHGTTDNVPSRSLQILNEVYDQATEKVYFRPKADIERFFDGLEIVSPYTGADPAPVHVGLWGCEDVELADSDGSHWGFCAVARKP